MRVTNMIQIKHNKLRIPSGGRLTSWLFTRRGGVEFGATEDKSIQWQDLNPGPPDYESSALPLGHARLPRVFSKADLKDGFLQVELSERVEPPHYLSDTMGPTSLVKNALWNQPCA